MKFALATLLLTLLLAGRSLAGPVADDPSRAVLKKSFNIPVISSGQQHGWIAIPVGSTVTVKDAEKEKLLIDFAGAEAWVPRLDTDFDIRVAAYEAAQQPLRAAQQQAAAEQAAQAQERIQQANAAWQARTADYVSPLEKGPYGYNRSVVDYIDECGGRYNIGVFGQRIYN